MPADLYASSGLKPQMDAADEVLTQLFPHQREALAWMITRENSNGLPPFWQGTQAPGGLLYTNRCGGGRCVLLTTLQQGAVKQFCRAQSCPAHIHGW